MHQRAICVENLKKQVCPNGHHILSMNTTRVKWEELANGCQTSGHLRTSPPSLRISARATRCTDTAVHVTVPSIVLVEKPHIVAKTPRKDSDNLLVMWCNRRWSPTLWLSLVLQNATFPPFITDHSILSVMTYHQDTSMTIHGYYML